MKIIIVDDEYEILEDIKYYIQEYPGFEVVGSYTNSLKALEEIKVTKPDCVFLDIEMPGINGTDLAEKLLEFNPKIEVIFITAFNHYATEAFEVNAMDYILKPIHPIRLEKAIQKLKGKLDKPVEIKDVDIDIRSLGSFEVLVGGKPIKWSRSKSKELLAYLLHYKGRKITKYKICEYLWYEYDPKKALVNLQTAMYSLRKSLAMVSKEKISIEFSEDSYGLVLGNVVWDALEFDNIYERVKYDKDITLIEKAINLYQGDYMGGEDWNWQQLKAENLSLKYGELLKSLADLSFQNGKFNKVIGAIMKLSEIQVLDKNTQLMLTEAAYCSSGITGLSIKVNFLKRLFREEYDLDIEPDVITYCRKKGLEM